MSDLIERLRVTRLLSQRNQYALQAEAANKIEEQEAEIAEYKKQIKKMGSSVQHYEHLAMKFSSQADVYSHGRQRAWAEIARLRGLVVDAKSTVDDAAKLYGDDDLQNCADNILGAALEQKP